MRSKSATIIPTTPALAGMYSRERRDGVEHLNALTKLSFKALTFKV
jgi:hypothetical protein